MSTSEAWTIERICGALGNSTLAQRFLGEINRTPAHELLAVFARWERIAKDTLAAVERARELASYDEAGEELPGQWTDMTERVQSEAAAARGRGAA
ncbi:hypothetical protein LKL35_27330 [Streptomyces sp. ET3-23]|uniref:hypothetical protein n=1 Tax=Streptomyces sp. ET3-23 TaxID=2885643 RepID=UPI001D125EFA|nr:hypothetical protein [Streptomyces sp. ET3-23]MCC2279110.1 hypothetical protein [Streptomyces sp. ET3-23]